VANVIASKAPLLGAHMSIAGEVSESLNRGKLNGCDCIQIFTKSSRQWESKPYTNEEVSKFRRIQRDSGIASVIAHDSYLLNLGAPNEGLRRRSVKGLIDELKRCEALGIPHLVAHPGAHVGSGEQAGLKAIARSLDETHASTRGLKVSVALENTAGQGTVLGYTFEQLGRIIDSVKEPDRLTVCFDTEHAFAAGYDLRVNEGYERAFGELDKFAGLKRLVAFHLNDSVKPLSSRVDRHEHIGKGYLGREFFRRLLADARFFGLPMCLETDPGEENKGIRADLKTLRSLLTSRK
jgi:deoxyribonuclease-4